ncbi:MAG: MBL fold metallo-hydrolase [candidate division WOR-3 bacterium]|nr:MBL fold metallo-hydrolase [candidate division WOR-3 bacterium]MCX7947975.1 MBL fold metallo-hydrolase [candidate division WOR-3 bacterium]MDW8150919.1 MBL fold metallo-hydrolase [candidate division WOR-3 bacterium]
MQFKKFTHPIFNSNSYIIYDSQNCIIVDPTDIASQHIIYFVEKNNLKPICIVNTHGHYDHISGNDILASYFNLEIYIHEEDSKFLSDPSLNLSTYYKEKFVVNSKLRHINENQRFMNFKIIHVPGHTPGSICLKYENMLICGDLIFSDSIGRVDLPLSSEKDMKMSLKKIMNYIDKNTIILPGHGKFFYLENLYRENEILWSFINS